MVHIVVVGGGIVGLAVAERLTARGDRVTLLEKESGWARHQTGRNSGVIHSGLYYVPGSLKATLCQAGRASMVAFAAEHDIPHEICGKLVVATTEAERGRLAGLQERALANGVKAQLLDAAAAREIEPHVSCLAALHVPETGIIDYTAVSVKLAELARAGGADLRTDWPVDAISTRTDGVVVASRGREVHADALVNCAGLHSDRIAALAGLDPEARIVPFRGEYFELGPQAEHLVNGLIYPVPDPRFPFLGVHLTKMIGGGIHAGPNAVLALARQGYRWRDVNPRDLAQTLAFPGLWRLARHNVPVAAQEIRRSLSRKRFADSLARLVPEVTKTDLVRAPAGVRAQAMRRDGSLVDDFLIQRAPRQVHVLNAPSPAATSSLEIARQIVDGIG